MLTLWGANERLCDGLSRRDFLRIGGLGASGLTLADLLRLRTHGGQAAQSSHPARLLHSCTIR